MKELMDFLAEYPTAAIKSSSMLQKGGACCIAPIYCNDVATVYTAPDVFEHLKELIAELQKVG